LTIKIGAIIPPSGFLLYFISLGWAVGQSPSPQSGNTTGADQLVNEIMAAYDKKDSARLLQEAVARRAGTWRALRYGLLIGARREKEKAFQF
jgi:hypothetical protein